MTQSTMTPSRILPAAAIFLAIVAISCTSNTGPDSNTNVFQTPEQAAVTRKKKLMSDWQDLACRIANSQRPDVRTIKHPGQPFSLLVIGDGVQHPIDLNPIFNRLMANQGQEREPIVNYLNEQMPEFDRVRLKTIGFDRARELLWPMLANMKQTAALAAAGRKEPPITNKVVIDLNWVPVARWPGTEASTPIDADIASAWKVSENTINDAAMANLKREFGHFREPYDSIDLPGLGRYGTLRADASASFVLLPEFLAMVRRQWDTRDNLVLFMPSRTSVMFLESQNRKALDAMYSEWSRMYTRVSDPLIGQLVLATDKGLELYSYLPPAPTTKPVTRPTTRRTYIVD